MSEKKITHTYATTVNLKPFYVPENVRCEEHCGPFQLEDLTDAALLALVRQWVDAVYASAGKTRPKGV